MISHALPENGSLALLQLLQKECELLRQFVGLLGHEQALLRTGEVDKLSAITEQKNSLSGQLNALSSQRLPALAALGFSGDRSGMEGWQASLSPSDPCRRTWDEILLLARQARDINTLNGNLIHIRMQHNHQAMESLKLNKGTIDLYGPDGQTASSGNRRVFGEA